MEMALAEAKWLGKAVRAAENVQTDVMVGLIGRSDVNAGLLKAGPTTL